MYTRWLEWSQERSGRNGEVREKDVAVRPVTSCFGKCAYAQALEICETIPERIMKGGRIWEVARTRTMQK